jgi:hypothetical protein
MAIIIVKRNNKIREILNPIQIVKDAFIKYIA